MHVADLLFLVHLVAVQNAAEDYAGAVKARPSVLLIFATSDLNLEQPQVEFVSRSPLEVQNQWQLTDVHSCSR